MEGAVATSWRVCVDLGTSAAKVSLGARREDPNLPFLVHPLRIGEAAGEDDEFLVPSAMLFDGARVKFGAAAIDAAESDGCSVDLLQSFKLFLSARDVDQALSLALPRSVDPSCLFTQRGALTLYAAYILALAGRAAAKEAGLSPVMATALRRYVYPLWGPTAGGNNVVARVFDEAQAVASTLGNELLDKNGLSLKDAQSVLRAASAAPGNGRIEAGVFEAHAAAACHSALGQSADFALVFDMGAGTTDFTLLRGRGALLDVPWGRGTLALGCDEVDKILVAMFMDRAPRNARPGAERAAWRRLKLRARKLKERLLLDGECSSTIHGKKIVVRLGELERDKAFRTFKSTLRKIFGDRAREALAAADNDGVAAVDVIPTGGGALMPFVLDAMKQARSGLANKERLKVQPPTPKWLAAYPFDEGFKFPQMAVSIGGAIATLLPSEAQF